MENFKFIVFSIIALAVMGLLGYWAVKTIEPGGTTLAREKAQQLADQNVALQKKVDKLKSQVTDLTAKQATPTLAPATTTSAPASTLKYQGLINDLQKLVDNKVFMKEKSAGAWVGTVQTFLNIYNNTSKKVDNDYGPSTNTAVLAFQKAVGLTADGTAGPSTFQKMIDWLKKQ